MALQPGGCVHLAQYRPQELPGGHRHVGHDPRDPDQARAGSGQASDPADAEDA
jgi:hypothetical protein